MNWDDYFLAIADVARGRSKDPHTTIGAVIADDRHNLVSTGYNGFPRGISDLGGARWERPLKYQFVEHAERNAIYIAADRGVSVRGCTLYLVAMGPPTSPCTECARGIIQCGIKEVVGRAYKYPTPKYAESQQFALGLFAEAGVVFREVV